ncbi:MAG: 2-amino-4-hydroxy-6-hydroxymethyldihydropteridine diphosphokinase [Ramlibacter sp.]
MRDAVTAYIGLGANLGDAAQAVRDAIGQISALPQTTLTRHSSLYRTAPIDAAGPDYVNAVAELATHLSAPELLAQLQRLELQAGRRRPYRNAPRTLDLDLLLFGDGRIASAALTVPHPRLRERAFVLVPLAEIAPQRVPADWLAAVAGQPLKRLPPA